METGVRPWPALWSLVIGFFMILVDSTIVSVAMPAIMDDLDATIADTIWVNSAYLLAFAVPLLMTGRLGDRFGPKNIYLIGLTIFTIASGLCGLSHSIVPLVIARVLQGFGASMMTPQTMAVITRTFPPNNRGAAMALWGAVAGLATLTGPLLGGLLVGTIGWEWIFFINIPIGLVAFFFVVKLVPKLEQHSHTFDIVGVALSSVGMFCLVFGLQESDSYNWGIIYGPVNLGIIDINITVLGLIGAGILVLGAFITWQRLNRREPLLPLGLFKDRNFALASIGISSMAFAVTSMAFPLMLYAQSARGFAPFESALLLVPMAVLSGLLAPVVGKLVDRINPRSIAAVGFGSMVIGLAWLGTIITPTSSIFELILPTFLLGIGNAGVWAPLSTSATRNLPQKYAGAGSGVYNAMRQIGAVLGSAGIAAIMSSRQTALLEGVNRASADAAEKTKEALATAMGQSLYLPAAVLTIGFIVVLFFEKPARIEADQAWSKQAASA